MIKCGQWQTVASQPPSVSVPKLLRKATASQLVTTTILAEALRKGWFVLEPKRLENASATFRSVTVDIRRRRRCC